MRNRAESAATWVLVGAAALPLVAVTGHFIYPFVVPRVLLARVLAAVALPLLVVAAARGGALPRSGPARAILAGGLAPLAWMAVSAFFAEDVPRALHDSHERMFGLVTQAHLAILFLVGVLIVRGWRAWRRVLLATAAVAVVVAVVAVLQKVDPELLANQGSPRVGSTLGQPTDLGWFGGYAILLAVLLAVLLGRWTRAEGVANRAAGPPAARDLPPSRDLPARFGVVALATAGTTCLLLSETRSALLGMLVAAGWLGVVALRDPAIRRRLRWPLGIGGAGLVAAATVVGALAWLEHRLDDLRADLDRDRAGLLMRFLEVGDDADASGASGPGAGDRDEWDEERWRVALERLRGAPAAARAARIAALERFRVASGAALDPIEDGWIDRLDPALLTAANRARPVRDDRVVEERFAATEARWRALLRVPGLRRFGRVAPLQKTVGTRRLKWDVAIAAGRDRPAVGVGPCGYFLAYTERVPPAAYEHGYQETWVDNAHNVLLNAFATGGVPGAIAEALRFALPAAALLVARRRRRVSGMLAGLGVAAILFHLTYGLLVFDTVTSWLGFATILALLARAVDAPVAEDGEVVGRGAIRTGRSGRPAALVAVAALAATAVSFSSVWATAEEAAANRALHDALRTLGEDADIAGARARLAALFATPGGPHVDDGRLMAATPVIDGLGSLASAARARGLRGADLDRSPRAVEMHGLAGVVFDALADVAARRPWDVRPALRRARIALALDALWGDPARLEVCEDELVAATARSPGRQEVRYLLADVRLRLARPLAEIVPVLEATIAGAPRVGESWLRLAHAYRSHGQEDAARVLVRAALRQGARFRPDERAILEGLLR